MSKAPKKLPQEDLDEIERRALGVLARMGVREDTSPLRWRREATIYQNTDLMLVLTPKGLVVRVRFSHSLTGMDVFQLAYSKDNETSSVEHVYRPAETALQQLRTIMVLEDLSAL
ncbi:MAG: hypothetical protein AB7L09_01550 [Nitrospira sp.]